MLTGDIILIVLGSVSGVSCIAAVILFIIEKKRMKNKQEAEKVTE